MSWNFTWNRDWKTIRDSETRDEWQDAFRENSGARVTPFGHPVVVQSWLDACPPQSLEPFLMSAAHDDGRRAFHLFVRPLGDHKRAPSKVMYSAGGDFFDYTEPVILPAADGTNILGRDFWDEFSDELASKKGKWFDALEIPRLREEPLDGFQPSGPTDVAPYVKLEAYNDFEAYIDSRSTKFRRDYRKYSRRLIDAGGAELRTYGPMDFEKVRDWIPDLVREKYARYSISQTPDLMFRYLENLVSASLPIGLVSCSTLNVSGRPVSWRIDFRLKGTFYSYMNSFHREWADFGVGNIHALRLVEWCFSENLGVFDLLWGDEDYKRRWTDGEMTRLVPFEVLSNSPLSIARRMVNKGRRSTKFLGVRAK